jgi:GTP:adenosylcobinamide-phosphate guanylyltransferase
MMDVLITAGGIPRPGEHLYEQTMGLPKALVDIHGRPMIQWVLDAVSGSSNIQDVFIVGLHPDAGLVSRKTIHYIDGQGGALDNVIAGAEELVNKKPDTQLFLMVSSDIPALTTEMVDWTIAQASDRELDIYYFTIHQKDMEARYPGSHRTYTRFKNVELCSADIFVVRAEKVINPSARWRDLLAARKSPLKQAAIIGFDILLLMLLRQITLEDAVKTVVKRLDLTGRVSFTPYAEMGMDVDKTSQLEIMRQDLLQGRN